MFSVNVLNGSVLQSVVAAKTQGWTWGKFGTEIFYIVYKIQETREQIK